MRHITINLVAIIALAAVLTSSAVLAVTTTTPTSTVDVRETQIINDTRIVVEADGSTRIIRNNYSQAIKKYQASKGAYISLKQQFSASQSIELKQKMISSGRQFLIRCDETIINYLDNLKSKLITAGALAGSRISATSQELETLVQDLLAEKNNLDQMSTEADLKYRARILQRKWDEIKYLTQLSKAETLSAKIRKMISQLDDYGSKINARINELDGQSIQTESVKDKFVRFNENLLQVKIFFNNAQGSFAQLQETGSPDFYEAGLTNLKQSRAMLKLVGKSLGEVIGELKKL